MEILQHVLQKISNILLMDGYNTNVWQDIEIIMDPDPFCTFCEISSMNENVDQLPNEPKTNAVK